MTRLEMEQLAAGYDAGLVAETGHSASRRLCLTNKLFSFLLAGIPPVMSDTPAHCRFATEAGILDLIYPREKPRRARRAPRPAFRRSNAARRQPCLAWRLGQERYNWEREQGQLVEAVARAGFGRAPVAAVHHLRCKCWLRLWPDRRLFSARSSLMTIRDLGLAVVRTALWLEQVGRWVYAHLPRSLHDTPTSRLRAHFARESRVTFVHIGADDGVAGDPIRCLVVENDGWSGVMVEPQPDAFDRLQRNYADQSRRLQFLNVAISDASGERTLFCIPKAEQRRLGLSGWAGELASFSREHLLKHFPHPKYRELHGEDHCLRRGREQATRRIR